MEREFNTQRLSGDLACKLDQHEWVFDPEDVRFRICMRCNKTEYLGGKGGKDWRYEGTPKKRPKGTR